MANTQIALALQRTIEGLKPHTSMPEYGSEEGRIARLKAAKEVERKSKVKTLHDVAVQAKKDGNQALEEEQHHQAVIEYNRALEYAHKVAELLECERQGPPNAYQLRALARGQKLPKTGPESIDPFRALVLANRSLALLRLHAFDDALDDANESCQLEPRYLKAWIRRALILVATNKVERALAVLDEALEKACHVDAAKEAVCKLIVNIRSVSNVFVVKPHGELPPVFRIPRETSKKPLPAKRKVKISFADPEEEGGSWRELASKDPRDETESSIEFLRRVLGYKAGGSAIAEVDASDFNVFVAEDWHVTHLGGRWRQTMTELAIVVNLPRRPKASELRVQIRTSRLWVLLQIPGTSGGAREDFDTIVDHALSGAVQPAESCWYLEPGEAKELHFTLVKHHDSEVEAQDNVLRYLWTRAFEDDIQVNANRLAMVRAARAKFSSMSLGEVVVAMRREALLARVEGEYEKAAKYERFIEQIDKKLGIDQPLELAL